MFVPPIPKIYHIVHVDRLASIIADGCLWSDSEVQRRGISGTTIGMSSIKKRRLANQLSSHDGLYVGECVPFYFCPRSVMLYVIRMGNHPELQYRGGQRPILHLEADLGQTVDWADANGKRWAFTTSNAGSNYFEDFDDRNSLAKIDWNAVNTKDWRLCKDEKQAEFLVEESFPWHLVTKVGVISIMIRDKVGGILQSSSHRPPVQVTRGWYY